MARKKSFVTCCELVKPNREASAKLMKLRMACGLDLGRAARMFSLEMTDYLQVERAEFGFRDWQRCMEVMCILSNQPLDLINRV